MPLPDPAPAPDHDRHGRRAVWIAALITIIGTGMIHADKAAEDRGAFLRWRHQIVEMMQGVNIYDEYFYPNPPIMPLSLYPLMKLPPVAGALAWFTIKAAMAAGAILLCFRMVRFGTKPVPSWVQAAVVLLSLRPVMSDLHHANNNLLILFLIVSCLYAWRKGYDVLAGMILALSIAYKVTPALFLAYFVWKRQWRTVGATFLGLGVFLLIVPSIFLGPGFNGICLGTWWHRILSPYVSNDKVGDQEINQSLVGVLTRLMTETNRVGRYGIKIPVNFVDWNPKRVVLGIKLLSVGLVLLLAWLCRVWPTWRGDLRRFAAACRSALAAGPRDAAAGLVRLARWMGRPQTVVRTDPRLFGEFSLVVLTMLFVSERSWKHHFVTLVLPFTYLAYRAGVGGLAPRARAALAGSLVLAALLMAATSTEIGGLFGRQGHKVAQAYGMFLWAGVVLYVATAWRVRVEGGPNPASLPLGRRPDPAAPAFAGPAGFSARPQVIPRVGADRQEV